MRARSGWLLAIAPLAMGCSRRPHVGARGDAGPAVVLVERAPPPARDDAMARLPATDEVEPNDDILHAQTLAPGTAVRANLEARPGQPADVDWYQVAIPATANAGPSVLRIEARPETQAAPLRLEAHEVDGKPITDAEPVPDAPAGAATVIPNLAVDAGRTIALMVTAARATPVAVPYRLAVTVAPLGADEEREPNDRIEQASPLALGVAESGYFGRRGDRDWLRLAPDAGVPDGGALSIELSAVDGVSAEVRVGEGRHAIAEARGGRGEEVRMKNAPAAGALLLEARAGANVDERWSLRVNAAPAIDGAEREPNDKPSLANPLSGDIGQVAGWLWPGDHDVYRLTAPASPSALRLELVPPAGVDVKLERLNDKGSVLLKVDEGKVGQTERIEGLAVAPGESVLVRVSARAHDTAFDAPYQLSWVFGA